MSGSNTSDPAAAKADAEPLAFTVHRLDVPDLASPEAQARRTRQGRLRMLLVLAVCAAPVVASYFMYYVVRPQSLTSYGTLIQPTRGLPPALALTTLDGAPVAARSLRGQWLLVTVGPSACDTGCEARLLMQRQLREMLGRERERIDKLWFVIDGGAVAPALRAAIEAKPALTALRADPAALAAWLAPAPGQALQDHLYLVDPHGEWMMRWPVAAEPARVKRDLDRLLRAAASWDLPGR
ncbi:conserved hypothetical protein [Rubrivivax sp. A210]|uniref:SCO family protein n=1 Tax=Rubrivivax sp. A210 TaxID=2772301 RepID=UPI001917B4D4|nr:hypothetical protein [Rubrivivax sp. A210]CAD5372660.1 conserved hypothetical protein [Rubrivivax sp. A210]